MSCNLCPALFDKRRLLGKLTNLIHFQYWLYSKDGEIRRDESCIDYAGKDITIFPCHSMRGNQEWKYDHKIHQLLHVVSGKCMEMSKDGARLLMTQCETGNSYQSWTFQEYDEDKARQYNLL